MYMHKPESEQDVINLLRAAEDLLALSEQYTLIGIPSALLDALDRLEATVLAAKGELPANPNDERRLS